MVATASDRLSFRNDGFSELTFIVEPWAEEFTLMPDSELDIIIHHTISGHPRVVIDEKFVVVGLWSTCTCEVLIDGKSIGTAGLNIAHP